MKNISKKSLALAALVLSFLTSEVAFAESDSVEKAAQNKTSEPTKKETETAKDRDLKLSIEELRKKYPISLLDEKKKHYKPEQKISIDDYSAAEIKAAFLNADQNFVSRKKVKARGFKIGDAGIWVDEEVSVKDRQELIIIGRACDKLRHSNWSKLNKKWDDLFHFIFSDDLPIGYYAIKYVPYEEAGFCLDSVEEARGL